jgi:hypothetical protein
MRNSTLGERNAVLHLLTVILKSKHASARRPRFIDACTQASPNTKVKHNALGDHSEIVCICWGCVDGI